MSLQTQNFDVDAPATTPIRVLLADDHPTNRTVVELILGVVGAEVVSVEDGAQAVELVEDRGRFVALKLPVPRGVGDGPDEDERAPMREPPATVAPSSRWPGAVSTKMDRSAGPADKRGRRQGRPSF